MDGYTAYIQYLENIRKNLKNCEMNCVTSRNILKIFKRVDDIEDLAYIDIVLKEAGLDISFFGDREFLSKKVQKKKSAINFGELSDTVDMLDFEEEEYLRRLDELSKLEKFDMCEFRDTSEDCHSYSEYVEKNKAELEKIWEIMQSITKKEEEKERKEEEKRQQEEEKQKEIEKRKSEVTEETDIGGEEFSKFDISEIVEGSEKLEETDEIDEIDETEETEDINILDDSSYIIDFEAVQKKLEEKAKREEQEREEKEKELEEIKDTEETEDLEESEESEESEDDELDTDFLSSNEKEEKEEDELDTDFLNSNENEEKESENSLIETLDTDFLSDDEDIDEIDKKENSSLERLDSDFLRDDDGEDEDIEDDEEDEDIEDDEEENEEDRYLKNRKKNRKIEEFDSDFDFYEDENELNDTDPIEDNRLETARDCFLMDKPQSYTSAELRELYKSKEKIIDDENVSKSDDATLKFLLAITDKITTLPGITTGMFKKAKQNQQKLKEMMFVDSDEMEEEDFDD